MTGWIIAGGIIAVILILLMTSVKVRFEYCGDLRLKISWLFLTFVRIPVKPKKKRRKKKPPKKTKASAEVSEKTAEPKSTADPAEPEKTAEFADKSAEPEKKPEVTKKPKSKLGLGDILELVKLVWGSLSKPLQRLLKATRIIGFRLNIVCGGSDAAKAALNYGRTNIAAGAALAFLDGCFTLKKPDLSISCDFLSEETRMECEFTAKLTPMAALAFLFWVLGRAVKRYLGNKRAAAAIAKLRK